MARPSKKRRICHPPDCKGLLPIGASAAGVDQELDMTVDEYETIRLIDYEGLTQEECAVRMDVARTTVQAIYDSARAKLAQCLVLLRPMTIDGGNYSLCDGSNGCGQCGGCK